MVASDPSPRPGRLDRWPAFLRVPLRSALRVVRRLAAIVRRLVVRLLWRLGPGRVRATWRWCAASLAAVRDRRRSPRLTVGIDINPFWEPLTGVGWYLYLLLNELAADDQVALRLYGPGLVGQDAPAPAVTLPRGPAIEVVRYPVPDDLCLPAGLLVRGLRLLEMLLVAADSNRVVFAPNYFLPRRLRWARGRLVATIHDLSFRRFAWTMREETYRDLLAHFDRTVTRARYLITDSETVRAELIATTGVAAERVHAVHLGPGHLTHGAAGAAEPPPLPVPADYVLHVGTLEPRKNVSTLLAVWRELRPSSPPPLVLCGAYGWKSEALRREVEAACAEGWAVHLGYVADAALAALYRRARLLVCASLYEGFGLPLVEAMWASTPVVCSDIPIFREVAAEAACFVPTDGVAEWVAVITELLADDARRRELGCRGRAHAETLDWGRTARATVGVWRRAAGATVANAP